MKRVTAILVVAIIGVAIGTWTAAAWIALHYNCHSTNGRRAGPRAALPTTSRDLGTVPGGAPLVARFTIHNEGGRRLIVRLEDAACCGKAVREDVTIVTPGHSAELVAAIDATGQHGRLKKTVAYTTNDQALPRFELTVSADISKPIKLGDEGALVR